MIWASIILKVIIPAILVLLNLHQFLYNKYPKYYFFIVKKFKKWRDTKWNVNSNYLISDEINGFKVIESSINKIFGNYIRTVNIKNKKQYNFADFSLLVVFNADQKNSSYKKIELEFNPINVTYKVAQSKISELRDLFQEIESGLNSKEKNYVMRITFSNSKNPFFGLMIQRLGNENVKYFECLFDLKTLKKVHDSKSVTKNNYNIRVYRDNMVINETNFSLIESIALDILLMR